MQNQKEACHPAFGPRRYDDALPSPILCFEPPKMYRCYDTFVEHEVIDLIVDESRCSKCVVRIGHWGYFTIQNRL